MSIDGYIASVYMYVCMYVCMYALAVQDYTISKYSMCSVCTYPHLNSDK